MQATLLCRPKNRELTGTNATDDVEERTTTCITDQSRVLICASWKIAMTWVADLKGLPRQTTYSCPDSQGKLLRLSCLYDTLAPNAPEPRCTCAPQLEHMSMHGPAKIHTSSRRLTSDMLLLQMHSRILQHTCSTHMQTDAHTCAHLSGNLRQQHARVLI